MPSVADIAQDILELNKGGTTSRNSRSVVAKLGAPAPLPTKPGLYTLSPEQLLSVQIPHYHLNGHLEGYQQAFNLKHARAIGRAMLEGRDMPVVEYSLGEDGAVNATDGQHRTFGGVIFALPVRAVITTRTLAEQRRLYADQAKGKKPNRTTLIIAGDGPFETYVLDALTREDHPWSKIVGEVATPTRISAATMHYMLSTYVGNALAPVGRQSQTAVARFDTFVADELADVVRTFGTKTSNPLAFEAYRMRAIAATATLVLRRSNAHGEDFARWQKHMIKFSFAHYSHVRRAQDLIEYLIGHWNKSLPNDSARRVGRA